MDQKWLPSPAWKTLVDLAEAIGVPLAYRSLHDLRSAVKERISALERALSFPSMNGTGDPGDHRPYDRYELPEPSWTARSQIQEARHGIPVAASEEVTG